MARQPETHVPSHMPISPPQVDSSKGPPRKIRMFVDFLHFFVPWKQWPGIAPNGARVILFPTNPDLANILGRTDLDFKILSFGFVWIPG